MPTRSKKSGFSVGWTWAALISLWAIFLSGALSWHTGTPGLWQLIQLKHHLSQRKADILRLETEVAQLHVTKKRLETDASVQEQAIREVLGYASEHEIIFEFNE